MAHRVIQDQLLHCSVVVCLPSSIRDAALGSGRPESATTLLREHLTKNYVVYGSSAGKTIALVDEWLRVFGRRRVAR